MREGPILVVEDDETILFTVAECLELAGYLVVTAANGAEALEQVERQLLALILLDMRMPVLDGWGFVRALRERRLDLKILVMSAASDARIWAHEVEAQGVLPKPFDLDDLLAAVGRYYGPPQAAA